MSKLSGILSGVSGEYFVAAELSRRGIIASITLRNTKGVDILASSADASKTVAIQVKTKNSNKGYWVLHQKAEQDIAKNLFYVFVSLNKKEMPTYHIVPSKDVSKKVKAIHKEWMATPSRKGEPHKDTTMRMFTDTKNKYLDRWDLLKLDMID